MSAQLITDFQAQNNQLKNCIKEFQLFTRKYRLSEIEKSLKKNSCSKKFNKTYQKIRNRVAGRLFENYKKSYIFLSKKQNFSTQNNILYFLFTAELPINAHKYIKLNKKILLLAEFLGLFRSSVRIIHSIFVLFSRNTKTLSRDNCYFIPEHKDEVCGHRNIKTFAFSYQKICEKDKSLLPLKELTTEKFYGKNYFLLLKYLIYKNLVHQFWNVLHAFYICSKMYFNLFYMWDELIPYLILKKQKNLSRPKQIIFSVDGYIQNLNLIFLALQELGTDVIAFHPSCSPLHVKIKNTKDVFLGSQAYKFRKMWDFSESTSGEWFKFMPFSGILKNQQKSTYINPIYTFNTCCEHQKSKDTILLFGETPLAQQVAEISNFKGDLYYFTEFIFAFYNDIFENAAQKNIKIVLKQKRPSFKYNFKNTIINQYDKKFFLILDQYQKNKTIVEILNHRVSPYDLIPSFEKIISFVYSTPGRVAAMEGHKSTIFYQAWDICEPILPEEKTRWVTGKDDLQKWLRN